MEYSAAIKNKEIALCMYWEGLISKVYCEVKTSFEQYV